MDSKRRSISMSGEKRLARKIRSCYPRGKAYDNLERIEYFSKRGYQMKWHQKALVRVFNSNILTFLFQLIAWCSVSLLIAIDKLGEFNLHVYLGALPIVIIQALVMTYLIRWAFKFCMKNIDIKGGI